MHYARWQTSGDPTRVRQVVPLSERLWAKISTEPGQGPNGDCWEWNGYRTARGYGVVAIGAGQRGKTMKAHRVAWQLSHGAIPEGMDVRHRTCDNPPCCRVDHLALGDHLENMRDKVAAGRSGRGIHRSEHKLDEPTVRAIRERHASGGMTYKQVGAEFGISGTMVGYLVRRMSWAHVE